MRLARRPGRIGDHDALAVLPLLSVPMQLERQVVDAEAEAAARMSLVVLKLSSSVTALRRCAVLPEIDELAAGDLRGADLDLGGGGREPRKRERRRRTMQPAAHERPPLYVRPAP